MVSLRMVETSLQYRVRSRKWYGWESFSDRWDIFDGRHRSIERTESTPGDKQMNTFWSGYIVAILLSAAVWFGIVQTLLFLL